jgi:hypothetical protein
VERSLRILFSVQLFTAAVQVLATVSSLPLTRQRDDSADISCATEHSLQLPAYTRYAKEHGQAAYIGEGENIWGNVSALVTA